MQASKRRRVLEAGEDCIHAVLLCHMKLILSDALNALITITTVESLILYFSEGPDV